jgi:hypothetical protein
MGCIIGNSTHFSCHSANRSSTSHKVIIPQLGFVDYRFRKRQVKWRLHACARQHNKCHEVRLS